MKASDLLGRPVHAADGRYLGLVTDLRCIQDGPLRGAMQTPRVTALIVSTRHTAALLGYDRRTQQGPWLIRIIVRRLHRHAVLIPWDTIAQLDERITLHHTQQQLPNLDDDPDALTA
jgi:sporulation protein YlmC with PRC-barrel domain